MQCIAPPHFLEVGKLKDEKYESAENCKKY